MREVALEKTGDVNVVGCVRVIDFTVGDGRWLDGDRTEYNSDLLLFTVTHCKIVVRTLVISANQRTLSDGIIFVGTASAGKKQKFHASLTSDHPC